MDTAVFSLVASHASGSLTPAVLGGALARMGKARPGEPRGQMRGQVLRLARTLPLEDPACVEVQLDVVRQGAVVRASARGPRAALVAWAFHALARELACTLTHDDEPVDAEPGARLEGAMTYLAASEGDVRAERERSGAREGEEEAKALLRWLAHEGEIALVDDDDAVDALAASLDLEDPVAFYETLLDSDAVDDVFASESETKALVRRFRARGSSVTP